MPEVRGIRDYNRIRRFLEHIYLYGFFSREDFERFGIGSAKDYDFGSALIRSIFPDSNQDALWLAGRKYPRISRSYKRSGEERMSSSFLLHTMDETEELPELLYLLSFLRAGKCSIDDLTRELELHFAPEDTSKYSTVRRRVLELADAGYVHKAGKLFSLSADCLTALSDTELYQFYDYVCFCGGVTYPRVAGSYLLRSVKRELLRRGLRVPAEAPFLLRHSVSANVFDEEMLYQLLDLMAEGRTASFTLQIPGHSPEAVEALPVALRADTRLGRWYLLAWDVERKAPMLRRIRDLSRVKRGDQADASTQHDAVEATRKAFAASLCSGVPAGETAVTIRAKLSFESFPAMRAQFLRELRIGAVTQEEDGEYYTAVLNDSLELLPLLRAYSPWLKLLPGQHGLEDRLREDLRAMRGELEERT